MSAPAKSARPARMWSIRWIVTLAMVGLATLTVGGVGLFSEMSARRALQLELQAQIALQAKNLAMVGSGALLSDVPEWTLLPLIRETLQRQPDYAFIVVVDRDGAIVADDQARRLGRRFDPPPHLTPLPADAGAPPGGTLAGNRELLVVSAPILHGDGQRLGMVWLGLKRAAIERRLAATRRQQFLILGLFLLLGTAAALGLSSALLRPISALRAGLERIGRGDLDTRLEVRDRTEIGALAGTINRMADELKVAQVELVEREHIAHEVQLAQRIQRSLLPTGHRISGPFVIEGLQEAASEVGGDYYQVLDLPGGRLGLVVADVSGKGLGGCLVTAMVHALLRPLVAAHDSPADLLSALDRQLGGMLERGSFVTMFYAVLDPEAWTLTFASAGHNPMLLVRGTGEIEWLRAKGAPLAALRGTRGARFTEAHVRLEPGDIAIQYTDGISEAPQGGGADQFGLERIEAAARLAASQGTRAVLEALASAATAWRDGAPRHDDETLLVVGHEVARVRGTEGDTDPEAIAFAMTRLGEARERGHRLTLPASVSALVRLDDWMAGLPGLQSLEGRPAERVRLALYEACVNVVEHALQGDASQTFDVWWVPASPPVPEKAAAGVPPGFFLMRDRGQSFRYQEWRPPALEDPAVRKRGRGLGIAILRRIAERVTYVTGTPEGNVTCLALMTEGSQEEEEHAQHH